MTFLVPVMMWGWIPFSIILFRIFSPQKAILFSVIGGVLFLPSTSYDIPMITYNKNTAIAVSLLLGIISSGKFSGMQFKAKAADIPILLWCIVSPFLSIITNGLGPYNAIAAVLQQSLQWGVYYMAGRLFFSDDDSLRLLTAGIITGGLIYVPLTLFEVRMSPQLSNIVYGFFPSSFLQQIRYGGYRPVIFMTHGLMVAFWMSISFVISFWLYKSREIININKIPMLPAVGLLLISTLLCKSANGIIFALLGFVFFYFFKKSKRNFVLKSIILIIPLYICLRISGILRVDTIINTLSKIFDAGRMESLSVRLFQEDIFGKKALLSPFFGWGWMDRAWPKNIVTGESLVQMIDSLYLIVFSINGLFGLFLLYFFLLLGPWKIFKANIRSIDAAVLAIVNIFFTIDSLVNGMLNPVFILIAGVLITISQNQQENKSLGAEKYA